jgi:hypothetical protein
MTSLKPSSPDYPQLLNRVRVERMASKIGAKWQYLIVSVTENLSAAKASGTPARTALLLSNK